jgi:hypothetical protein
MIKMIKQKTIGVSVILLVLALTFTVNQASAVEPLSTGLEGFAGYVKDNGGNPIQGALIAYGGLSSTTDANGYYEIFIGHRIGAGDLRCSKYGFFTEVIYNDDPEGGWYDFQLANDPYTMVTVVALFPNTNYAYMKYSWGYKHTLTVNAYTGAYGGTVTSTEEVTYSVDSPYPPRSTKRRAIASGAYDGSGNLLDLFIREMEYFRDQFYENEYLNPNSVSGETWGILPGSTVERTASLSGSVTFQGGLKTTVGVTILFVSISQELETTLTVTAGHTNELYWKITNTDSGYKHFFKVHYEGNTIPHIWDIGREPVGGGGGGGGCPILSVFDGTEFVTEGLLDIHNTDGIDITSFHTLCTEPKPVHKALLLQLTEHPQTHSFIDQVKLYAELEDGRMIELQLISAVHSEDGNVLPQLRFSDDWKTDTIGANLNNGTSQSIDLKFLAPPPNLKVTGFVFQIEGNNMIIK